MTMSAMARIPILLSIALGGTPPTTGLSWIPATLFATPYSHQKLSQPVKRTDRIPSLFASSDDDDEAELSNRRSFLRNIGIGGTLVTTAGIVGKQKIDGPPPFFPATGSMTGKVVLITGGTTGLGLESGKRLAASGATVIVTSRTDAKGAKAVADIGDYLRDQGVVNDQVYSATLNLDDLASVKAFPKALAQSPAFSQNSSRKIDVLMNNAGVMAIPDKRLTKDGYELTFETNHLGHFALTALVFPMLSNDARVITVSSEAYRIADNGLELDNLNSEREYGPWKSYGTSKLANILFTKELQRRADVAGRPIQAVTLHPGGVKTDLGRYLMGEENYNRMKEQQGGIGDVLITAIFEFLTRSIDRGASTQIFLAAGQGGMSNVGGEFFEELQPTGLLPSALDMEKAKGLWDISEKLTGVKFNVI